MAADNFDFFCPVASLEGILNVAAEDKVMKKKQSIVIRSSGGLSDAEIDRMVQDAEANATADEWRKAMAEVRDSF